MPGILPVFHAGDSGGILRVTIKERNATTGEEEAVDISGVSAKVFHLRSPKGRFFELTASFTTTGTDGMLQYAFTSGFFDPKDRELLGIWQVQVKLTGLSSWTGTTDIRTAFILKPRLAA